MLPLTHHDILALAGPLARCGRQVDLAASQRRERQIAFRPVQHADPALREDLLLDLSGPRPRLRRTLTAADGLKAGLEVEAVGSTTKDPEMLAALLAQIDAVPPSRQVQVLAGWRLAQFHRIAADGTLRLRGAQARRPGLRLEMVLTGVGGYPAELALTPEPDNPFLPPGDLLAVLGSGWSRLSPVGKAWQGSVRLKGEEAARSAAAEAALSTALHHLTTTLAEPPAQFHRRHHAARWAVVARESQLLVLCFGLVALALGLQRLGPAHAGWLALLANIAPPVLMGAFFLRREMPVVALPRPPRPPPDHAWGLSSA